MDGNRRWARQKGLPTFEGHRRGYDKLKEVGGWCLDRGIKALTVYAFSTENWNRSKEEVDYLMKLLERGLMTEISEFKSRGIKLRVIGRQRNLPESLLKAIASAEQATAANERGVLYVALNYGGRAEITDALTAIVQDKMRPSALDEELIARHLYAAEAPDLDLIIRTSGEHRTSGFMMWQAAYAELYFSPVYWPDFSEIDLDEVLAWYSSRQRRFGK